jgi:hypothetical protein
MPSDLAGCSAEVSRGSHQHKSCNPIARLLIAPHGSPPPRSLDVSCGSRLCENVLFGKVLRIAFYPVPVALT